MIAKDTAGNFANLPSASTWPTAWRACAFYVYEQYPTHSVQAHARWSIARSYYPVAALIQAPVSRQMEVAQQKCDHSRPRDWPSFSLDLVQ